MVNAVEVCDVGLTYQSIEDETVAIENIRLSIKPGEFIAFVGPSGCGKSTLLSIIAGIIKPTAGKVCVMGRDVEGVNDDTGYMLQRDHLLKWRTVKQNALLGLQVKKRCTEEEIKKVEQMFKDYGLGAFLNHYPHELSGGMRQKVALIRTLALNPNLLLLDEPFSALDYQTRLALCDEISTIIRKRNMTAVLVTHDISEAVAMADRVLVFTRRPAAIKRDIKMEFKSQIPMMRRQEEGFREYFDTIWKELDVHV